MYKTSTCICRELVPEDFDQALQIASQQFGNYFVTHDQLNQYIDSDKYLSQGIFDEGELLGFSLMQIGTPEEIFSLLQEGQEDLLRSFGKYEKVAYRSLTCVSKKHEGQGIGSLLVKSGLKLLSNKVELVVADAWKSNSVHIGNILEREGYQFYHSIPNYWTKSSIEENYTCQYCGTPPCSCEAIIYVKIFDPKSEWWERHNLRYINHQLHLGSTNIEAFSKEKQTPFYIYHLDRIGEKVEMIQKACHAQFRYQLSYAMKANRHPAILQYLRKEKKINVDVCSPNELQYALEQGFEQEQISYTGTSLSKRDITILKQHPKVHVNLDSLSAIRRFGTINKSRTIGLRLNPGIGLGYNESLEYTSTIVKFGIYEEQLQEAIQLCKQYKLVINTLHVHCGSGYLGDQLPKLKTILSFIEQLLPQFPSVQNINIGGGLGVMQTEGDQNLPLHEWTQIIKGFARKHRIKMLFEPGDFLVKDAGILVTEVNYVEEKRGTTFVGLDTGMNMNNEYAYYQMNLEPIPIQQSIKPKQSYVLAGNINEPVDTFGEHWMTPLQEDQIIALLNTGGYGASSSSNHCMRGDFKEYII